jgi:hypothetical protein
MELVTTGDEFHAYDKSSAAVPLSMTKKTLSCRLLGGLPQGSPQHGLHLVTYFKRFGQAILMLPAPPPEV